MRLSEVWMSVRWARVGVAAMAIGGGLWWSGAREPAAVQLCPEPIEIDAAGRARLEFPPETPVATWVCAVAQARGLALEPLADPAEVEGKVLTIISPEPMTPDAAWEAVKAALEVNGLTLDATETTATVVALPNALVEPDKVTRVIHLPGVTVDDAATAVAPFARGARVVTHPPTHAVIVTDTPGSVQWLADLAAMVVPPPDQPVVRHYRLHHAEVASVVRLLEALYAGEPEVTRVVGHSDPNAVFVRATSSAHEEIAALLTELDAE